MKKRFTIVQRDFTTGRQRRAHAYDEDFVMAVDDRVYSGKNAREEAVEAIMKTKLSLLWEDGQELKPKRIGHFKGFTLMSSFSGREGETPKLYLRGKHTYGVNLNTENPFGTIASMEYALCRLNIDAEEEKAKFERMEKALADYQEQLGRRALCASSGERVGERRMIYHLKTLTFFQEDFMASQPTHTAYIVIGAKKGGDKKANRREVGAVWPHKKSNGFDLVIPGSMCGASL